MSRAKKATRFGLVLAAAWSVALFVWNRVGDVAQARELLTNRGPIAEAIGAVVLSNWIGPAVAIGCLFAYLVLEHQWPVRWLSDDDSRAAAWRAHEARFAQLTGDLYALWTYVTETGEASWHVHRADGASMRDLQAFEAEAVAAAGSVAQLRKEAPRKFKNAAPGVDTWLNVVGALVEPKSDLEMTGSLAGRRHVGGTIDNVVEASRIACARLAAGGLEPSPRTRQLRCYELTRHIERLDEEINLAVSKAYAECFRRSVEGTTLDAADWLSLQFGPAQRRLFLTAPPFPQVYTAVPAAYAAEWQVAVGRLMHLRDLAQKHCDES